MSEREMQQVDQAAVLGERHQGLWSINKAELSDLAPQVQVLMARALHDTAQPEGSQLYVHAEATELLEKTVPWFVRLLKPVSGLILFPSARVDRLPYRSRARCRRLTRQPSRNRPTSALRLPTLRLKPALRPLRLLPRRPAQIQTALESMDRLPRSFDASLSCSSHA